MATDLPTVITASGLQPRSPAEMAALIIAAVTAVRPGFTANLPGSLIEDIVSTDTAALVECDSARVETVNSLAPYLANEFLLVQLGVMLGIPLGQSSNTSSFVIFTCNQPGFVIGKGFIVSDGTYQYVVQDGGIIEDDGQSPLLFVLASQSGSWAVPAGTINQIVTSVPSSVGTVTVVNPSAGVPGSGVQTQASYRAQVLQANLAASQGMSRYLKTLLANVDGVQDRLIAALQRDDGGWMIIVGGGDPYQVANAIWTALFDISTLVGSELLVAGITSDSPAEVSTFLNHGYAANQSIELANVNPSGFDGEFAVLEVVDEKAFTIGTRFAANNLLGASWTTNKVTAETTTPHGLTIGSTIVIVGCTPAAYNGTFVVTDLPDTTHFKYALTPDPGSISVLGQLSAGVALFDATALTWVSGGLITPNLRNIEVTINDYPDTYVIPFVDPPQQTVTMTVTWNTTSPNFVAPAAVAQLGAPAIADYLNAIVVGQPINLLRLTDAFQLAIASVLAPDLLTRLTFSISINGVATVPVSGTEIVEGDPESYFFAVSSGISVVQG